MKIEIDEMIVLVALVVGFLCVVTAAVYSASVNGRAHEAQLAMAKMSIEESVRIQGKGRK